MVKENVVKFRITDINIINNYIIMYNTSLILYIMYVYVYNIHTVRTNYCLPCIVEDQ